MEERICRYFNFIATVSYHLFLYISNWLCLPDWSESRTNCPAWFANQFIKKKRQNQKNDFSMPCITNKLFFFWTLSFAWCTYLDAVKICLELVQMALIGLSWPLISPMGVKLSTFHTLSIPPLQALRSMGRPGTNARAHTQSLCAFGICWGETSNIPFLAHLCSTKSTILCVNQVCSTNSGRKFNSSV